ncbi:hypothetical protein CDO51_01225 [Natranaerobius trueperi]|uniref:Uncharacterized protein n=1 Tax=Natranaerobius trueperi TaxID=759412 RepID=A0A226C1E2_9FIRM|nr:hypothetical protein CDO51_01225 [Natranaerobius trueperi]
MITSKLYHDDSHPLGYFRATKSIQVNGYNLLVGVKCNRETKFKEIGKLFDILEIEDPDKILQIYNEELPSISEYTKNSN